MATETPGKTYQCVSSGSEVGVKAPDGKEYPAGQTLNSDVKNAESKPASAVAATPVTTFDLNAVSPPLVVSSGTVNPPSVNPSGSTSVGSVRWAKMSSLYPSHASSEREWNRRLYDDSPCFCGCGSRRPGAKIHHENAADQAMPGHIYRNGIYVFVGTHFKPKVTKPSPQVGPSGDSPVSADVKSARVTSTSSGSQDERSSACSSSSAPVPPPRSSSVGASATAPTVPQRAGSVMDPTQSVCHTPVSDGEVSLQKEILKTETAMARTDFPGLYKPKFVFRHGGFAERYEVSALSRGPEPINPLEWFPRVWRALLRGVPGRATVLDPVEGELYVPFNDLDREYVAGLTFKPWNAVASISFLTAFVWITLSLINSVFWWFGIIPWAMAYPLYGTIVFWVCSQLFTIDERYGPGSWMAEVGEVRAAPIVGGVSLERRDPDARPQSFRDSPVTHLAQHVDVPVKLWTCAPTGGLVKRGLLSIFGPVYLFWKYEHYFKMREVVATRRIDVILAGQLIAALELSSVKDYSSALCFCKLTAARLGCILNTARDVAEHDIFTNTCRYAAMVHGARVIEDFRDEAPLPF